MLLVFFLILVFFLFFSMPLSSLNFSIQTLSQGLNFFFSFSSKEKTFSSGLILIFFCIMIYSFMYFKSGEDYLRFFFLLFTFFLSMLILIFHSSTLVLFMGWDGLGVSSYLLVCYYFNWKSLNGGLVTLMTNRIGDICLFWFLTTTLIFSSPLSSFFCLFSPSLIFILGAFTKSAQSPFSSWLPQAMSAPTPVSSLVHSSTLVTAGVFICLKYFCFFSSSFFLFFFMSGGVLTIFIAGLMALVEKDVKKIVALSTLSQMGLLVFSLGMAIPTFTFFHLMTHAMFKSCMFLQVGFYILTTFGSQESRFFSSPSSFSPLVNFFFFGCCSSLCGLFFSSGFLSKDLLMSMSTYSNYGFFLQFLFLSGVVLTLMYTSRMLMFISSSAPVSLYSFFSSLSSLFCSSPLFLGGVMGGWVMLNNSMMQSSTSSFLLKFFPFFLFFIFFFISRFFFYSKKIFNMCLQDNMLQVFLKVCFYPGKHLDLSVDLWIQGSFLDFFSLLKSLKSMNKQWPLGGVLFFLFFFLFFS